ncbi:MAG: glycoside hydrolase family 20 zincin-like fold domain-containing protein [Victivallaceae bacterium]|nr:glycoside hydrolase family 20 zincin-like fold domain-containing protein [Victivallaceae bacterium]
MFCKIIFLFVIMMTWVLLAGAAPSEVAPGEEALWLRYLIPLPHRITITRKVIWAPQDIAVKTAAAAGEVEKHAASMLKGLLSGKNGCPSNGNEFEILIGTLDKLRLTVPEYRKQLEQLPNRDQAYIICPLGNNRLLLTGLNEKGVYYAVRTLYQLLEPKLTRRQVEIPLARVLDWPDLEERGLWNFPPEWIPWLASFKLNYGKMQVRYKMEKGRKNRAPINVKALINARLNAFNLVPFITHLNFIPSMYEVYPGLAGKGDSALAGRYFAHKHGDAHRAPCATNPRLTEIIAEWMTDICSQGAREISCWLTERPAQCACVSCMRAGQFVAEGRAFVNAWKKVRKQYPDLVIRIFISTTANEKYYKLLAELSPEIKVERACAMESGRVRHLPRDLFSDPLFDYHAAHGTWLISYDVPFSANGAVETPEFKVPESSACRIKDFVRQLIARKYRGACGMTGWSRLGREICGFNYQAFAEFSWNLNGRSERDFTIAWATREGYAEPEKVGEWQEIMGPIEFDVYDSDFPNCYSQGRAIEMIAEKRLPIPGEGMFRYYREAAAFGKKLEACGKALKIAERFKDPYLANETRVVISYIKLAQAIYDVAAAVSAETAPEKNKQALLLEQLKDAGNENIAAIRQWRSSLGSEPWHRRVYDAIKAVDNTVRAITKKIQHFQ